MYTEGEGEDGKSRVFFKQELSACLPAEKCGDLRVRLYVKTSIVTASEKFKRKALLGFQPVRQVPLRRVNNPRARKRTLDSPVLPPPRHPTTDEAQAQAPVRQALRRVNNSSVPPPRHPTRDELCPEVSKIVKEGDLDKLTQK